MRGELRMRRMLAIIICLVLVLTATTPVFANDNGFNERGYNYKARVYNGFYAEDLYLVMKWSKDWTPMADEPLGAWCTNHLTWYSDDYSVDTWYGYETLTTYGEGTYRIEEFSKIMKVSDDLEKWAEYQAAGAFNAGWGNHANGAPKYVVFQDSVNVFDTETGALVYSTTLMEGVNKGLGKPIF
jgi:hypothetical protein